MAKYQLIKGRPTDLSGRLPKEIRCYDLLDELGMEYWHVDHPDAQAYTMEACLKIDEVLHAQVVKNLFLTNRQHTDYYLLLMPGDKKFKTKELSSQLGCSRLSFGTPEEMEELLDCAPGSASIMGLMNDKTFIGAHPCINTSSLKLRTAEVFGRYLEAVHHSMTTVTLVGAE